MDMLAAKIVLAAAIVNLIVLFTALAVNVSLAAFGEQESRARADSFHVRERGRVPDDRLYRRRNCPHRLFRLGNLAHTPVVAPRNTLPMTGGRLVRYLPVTYYLVIFAAGFAGSFHCIGMCGGFACALGRDPGGAAATAGRHLLYNAGRLTTYCFLGALAGAFGQMLSTSPGMTVPVLDGPLDGAQRVLAIVAGLLMIAISRSSACSSAFTV